MNTADRIKAVRGTLSQAEFAQEIGIHKNSLGRYERGESAPDIDTVSRICLNFGISAAWLVLGQGSMRPAPPTERTNREDLAEQNPQTELRSLYPPACQSSGHACSRFWELKEMLEEERRDRRELAAENRQLWKENASLREIVARLNEPELLELSGLSSLRITPAKERTA